MEQRGLQNDNQGAEGFGKRKQAFFIKKIPSKDSCLDILSFAFYKEEVERLLRMLSKQARQYYQENQDMIEQMKSMVEYDFQLYQSHQVDARNLSNLDLTCADFNLSYDVASNAEIKKYTHIFQLITERSPTAYLKKLSFPLTTPHNLSFFYQLANLFEMNKVELTKSNQQLLSTFIAQGMLKVGTLKVTLPQISSQKSSNVIKATNDQPTIITNGSLRNLTLKILTDLKDNYDGFTQLVLLSKSIGSFHLDLANHEFISDSHLLKYFSYTSMLYKLSLSNIKFSNKNSYIHFSSAIAQNNSIQHLELINCHFYDKFKAALFNCLNDRRPVLTTFVLANTVIDNSVIPGVATLIKRNPLRHLELRHLIKGKPMALPIEELFRSLVGKDSIKKLIFLEPSVKISGQVLKHLNNFLRSIRHLSILEIECENYEDIFESVPHRLTVDSLSISSFTFDKYSVNKLFFDMAQGSLLCSTLRLQGGLTDQHITKIVQLAKSKELKELSIAKNNITDEGASSIAQLISKARGLQSFDLSNNFIGNQGISIIAKEGLGDNKRLQQFNFSQNKFKSAGSLRVLQALQSVGMLQKLDLGSLILIKEEESEALLQLLTQSNSIEDIKLPKLIVKDGQPNEEACYLMLRAVLKSLSLNYCICPFFGIAMKFYDKQLAQNEKDDLTAVNLKKLDIDNFDISMYLSDGGFKDKAITAFLEANPRLWIKEHQSPTPRLTQRKFQTFT